tara:strand:- start:414 stop:749 length:336 start_codon:yes stop_codon:yes gene_type:complete
MKSPVSPYLKIHGRVKDMTGKNTIIGNAMRKNLLPHQFFQDFLLIIKLAKNPARMKNNGIRQICMNWKMVFIIGDELSSVGQNSSTFGMYGNAACKTMPRSIAIPLSASSP